MPSLRKLRAFSSAMTLENIMGKRNGKTRYGKSRASLPWDFLETTSCSLKKLVIYIYILFLLITFFITNNFKHIQRYRKWYNVPFAHLQSLSYAQSCFIQTSIHRLHPSLFWINSYRPMIHKCLLCISKRIIFNKQP